MAVVNLATADQRLAAVTEQWDANPWLLNTPGGVVDLHSGQVTEHHPEDYLTKITLCRPNPIARRHYGRPFLIA
jgi:phage/plasmid-associated DNA primase